MILQPFGFLGGFDADARAFITAAGITNGTQIGAINTLVKGLKGANLWTKLKAIYPMVGGTATTHKFNLKDPRDLDAAFRLNFQGGWTHGATGAKPNGTTGYADTFLTPSTSLTLYSASLSYYSRETTASVAQVEIGCENLGGLPSVALRVQISNTTRSGFYNGSTGADWVFAANTDSKGFFVGTRTTANLNKAFKNGSEIGNNTTTSHNAQPTVKIYLGALNDRNVAVKNFSDRECAFSSIGDGLNDTENSQLFNIVQTYQTTLARQV